MITVIVTQHPSRISRLYHVQSTDDGFHAYSIEAILQIDTTWDQQEPKIVAGIMASHNIENYEDINFDRHYLTKLAPVS